MKKAGARSGGCSWSRWAFLRRRGESWSHKYLTRGRQRAKTRFPWACHWRSWCHHRPPLYPGLGVLWDPADPKVSLPPVSLRPRSVSEPGAEEGKSGWVPPLQPHGVQWIWAALLQSSGGCSVPTSPWWGTVAKLASQCLPPLPCHPQEQDVGLSGADRLQTGMRGAFGEPGGTVAREREKGTEWWDGQAIKQA